MKKVFICTFLCLLACSQEPANVVYKGNRAYTKNYYVNNEDDSAPVSYTRTSDDKIARKLHRGQNVETVAEQQSTPINLKTEIVVKEGDTLYGIAEQNNISSREIIETNNLQSPYIVKVGQRLKIPHTKYHIVQDGENLYQISRKYDININSLVAVNNLERPYVIRRGDKIMLPSSASSYSITKVAHTEPAETYAPYKSREAKEEKMQMAKPDFKKNTFIWPTKGKVISGFGAKEGGLYNDGINIAVAEGTPFRATEDGVVAYVGNELRGYGNLIIIKHAGNWVSAYAHCQETVVKRGDKVAKGEVIGYVGSTGNVKNPQLYFSLRKGRKSINPQGMLI